MKNLDFSDDLVVEQAIRGDRNAFSTLYDIYAEKMYRHISYRVPNQADAEDITQEVFIRAWRAVGRYRIGKTPFFSWLLVIAKNLIADFYRVKQDHALLEPNASCPCDIDIQKEVEVSQKKDEVRLAISKLNKAKQKVLVMRFIEDRSYPEICHKLGKNEGAVRVLVYRALHDLKKNINYPAWEEN